MNFSNTATIYTATGLMPTIEIHSRKNFPSHLQSTRMADPLSIATGIITFVTVACQVQARLSDIMRRIENIPSELKSLHDDIAQIVWVVEDFKSALDTATDMELDLFPESRLAELRSFLVSCTLSVEEVEAVLVRVEQKSSLRLIIRELIAKSSRTSQLSQELQKHKASLHLLQSSLSLRLQLDTR